MNRQSFQPALQGIRVLDFSWVLAGPFATRLLADFGAEVIKIQPILPEAQDIFSRYYYNTWNRNKLGLSLDLSKTAGKEIVRRLVTLCDVVVENFSPRVMENWGLNFTELQKLNPRLIMLSLSMMGHSGPWRDYAGFGPAVQAFSGLNSLTDCSENEPLGPGFAYSDHVAGLYGTLALLGALEYRENSGKGQYIDLSQTECLVSLIAGPLEKAARRRAKLENGSPENSVSSGPEGVYPCRGEDRWCALTVVGDAQWQLFKTVLGQPVWANEERFDTVAGRRQYADELDEQIAAWSRTKEAEDVVAPLQGVGIAASAVNSAADLAADRHLREAGFFVHLQHPELGDTVSDAAPVHLSESPPQYRRAAPLRGQDNRYVLKDLLRLSDEEVLLLESEGVVLPSGKE